MAAPSRRRVVVVSFVVDLLDIVTNLIVALITGSAVVFSEMAQGLADSLGSAFLVIGDRRAGRPRSRQHPLGHEREAFFWAVLSAVTMLVIGASLSAWRGYRQLTDPSELTSSWLAIGVLVLAIFTNGYAVSLSVRNLSAGGARSLRASMQEGDRPLVKSAFLRDIIGTTTSIVGLAALLLYAGFGAVEFDAAGAIAAAVMLTFAALVLMAQARDLITGRSLPERDLERLRGVATSTPGIEVLNSLVAVHAGSEHVHVELDLDLEDHLDTNRIEALLDEVEARLRIEMPEISHVRVILNST